MSVIAGTKPEGYRLRHYTQKFAAPGSPFSWLRRPRSSAVLRGAGTLVIRSLASELRTDARSTKLPAAVSSGLVLGSAARSIRPHGRPPPSSQARWPPSLPRAPGRYCSAASPMCLVTALAGTYKGTVSNAQLRAGGSDVGDRECGRRETVLGRRRGGVRDNDRHRRPSQP